MKFRDNVFQQTPNHGTKCVTKRDSQTGYFVLHLYLFSLIPQFASITFTGTNRTNSFLTHYDTSVFFIIFSR